MTKNRDICATPKNIIEMASGLRYEEYVPGRFRIAPRTDLPGTGQGARGVVPGVNPMGKSAPMVKKSYFQAHVEGRLSGGRRR